jgi:putative DNA primase/helicase
MTAVRQFAEALVAAGLGMAKPGVDADGRLHRYRVDGDKAGSLNGWYVLHLEAQPFGAFGSWKTGQSETWTAADRNQMTEAERRALRERMAAAKAARDAEQAKIHAEARSRAAKLWARSGPAGNDHPYLVRKGVRAYGLRQLRGRLVIPLRDVDGELHTLQFISTDGKKTLLTGGRKRGCYHAIGRPERALCICEGYATGATIHEATGHATAIAFDAGNLEPVARALRGKFPRLAMVICADNDVATPGNPGLSAATAAALAVGAALAVPTFPEAAHV